MYSTIRTIIDSAWRRAGVRGDGDTPDDNDASYGLQVTNEVLDVLSLDSAFAPGKIKRTVKTKADGTAILGNDPRRVIAIITSTLGGISVTTTGRHGLAVNDEIIIQNAGTLITTPITATVGVILSPTQFTGTAVGANWGSARTGTWKLVSEPDNCLIDLVVEPPGQISQVLDGTIYLSEYPQDIFYEAQASGSFQQGWYYEPSCDPYPTLYTSAGSADLIFPQPGYTNVTLNTVVTAWPKGMDVIVLNKVAAKLANGYPDAIIACEQTADAALALFKRNRKKARAIERDSSAPGQSHSRSYDFYTDSSRGY